MLETALLGTRLHEVKIMSDTQGMSLPGYFKLNAFFSIMKFTMSKTPKNTKHVIIQKKVNTASSL